MEKRISYDQFQSVKRVAQACNPLVVKRDKLREKIEKLAAEYKDYDTQIASLEAGIKQVVGFRVEELVKKVIEPGVDANGQPKKTTKYLPTSIVSYDEKHKQYVITTGEDAKAATTEVTPEGESFEECEHTEAMPDSADPVNDATDECDDPTGVGTEAESENNAEEVPTDAPIFG